MTQTEVNTMKRKPAVQCFFTGPGFISFVIALLYVFGIHAVTTIRLAYDTAAIQMYLSGSLTGTQGETLLFIGYTTGTVIQFLYRLFPALNWYSLLLLFSIFLSETIILYRILCLTDNEKIWKRILVAVFSVVLFHFFYFENLAELQFTSCAEIAGIALIFSILTISDYKTTDILTTALLAVLCRELRVSIFRELAPYIFLSMLLAVVKGRDGGNNKKRIYAFSLMLVIIAILYAIPWVCESGAEETRELNSLRSKIQDYGKMPAYEENKAFYESIGITEEDVSIMNVSWGLSDHYNAEDMGAIVKYKQEQDALNRDGKIEQIRRFFIEDLWSYYSVGLWALLALSFIIALYIAITEKDRSKILYLAFVVIIALIEMLYLGYNGRTPERVISPVMHAQFFCYTGLSMMKPAKKRSDLEKTERLFGQSGVKNSPDLPNPGMIHGWVHGVFSVLAVCVFCVVLFENADMYRRDQETLQSDLYYIFAAEDMRSDAEHYYLLSASYSERLDVFQPQKINYYKISGWFSGTEAWREALYGNYSSAWDAMAYRKDLRYSVGSNTMKKLIEFLNNRGYDVKAVEENVNIAGRNYIIYRIEEVNSSGNTSG